MSHTTDDLVFQWLPIDKTPLAVDDGIQLPQLELIKNQTGDCTSVYSTGIVLDATFHETFVNFIRVDICFISIIIPLKIVLQEILHVSKSYSSFDVVSGITYFTHTFRHV